MNELEFKRHLKDLVHGHHHPEEHDWSPQPDAPRKAAVKTAVKKRRAAGKAGKRK